MFTPTNHRCWPVCAAVLAVTLLAVTGCLKRREIITVGADQSVTFELTYKGSPQDIDASDAMPSEASGWLVQRTVEEKDDGEDEVTLTTKRRFAPGATLPASFAAASDYDADLYLSFPTTLRVERREGGDYFHFRRVYQPRRWAYIQHWQDTFIDSEIKKLGDKPTDELTRSDKVRIGQAMMRVEAFKQIELARIAVAECGFDLAPDHWLLARQALLQTYRQDGLIEDSDAVHSPDHDVEASPLIEQVMDRCETLPDDQHDQCYDREVERILGRGFDALVRSLRGNAGVSNAHIAELTRCYQRARRYHEITHQLGGQQFEIRVKMPGKIIAHNGDRIEGDGVACWDFEGSAVRDRPTEIRITSRAAPAGGAKHGTSNGP